MADTDFILIIENETIDKRYKRTVSLDVYYSYDIGDIWEYTEVFE